MTDLGKLLKDPTYLRHVADHVRQELRGRYAGLLGLPETKDLVLKVVARTDGKQLVLEIEEEKT